ncbi:venom prothrombin activator oscutarin-C non-catalytic subunit-like [Patiria miniata]|uniref:F5/8 type C domain-containing protein n=1 Tax=Patiria miniata TaxID=46514 RepID=A0A914B039_PATMI|nr:venom prothrombin activator oscutarin-C non-catalytic subunit-like [Patiria miniata]
MSNSPISNLMVLAATLAIISAPLQLCSAHPVVQDVTSQDQASSSIISGPSCTSSPLGMASGAIPDSSLTASDSHGSYPPRKARLSGTGWWVCPIGKLEGQWIQVDLGRYTAITGVIVQGYPRTNHILTFAVNYSNTGESNDWQKLTDRGQTVQNVDTALETVAGGTCCGRMLLKE